MHVSPCGAQAARRSCEEEPGEEEPDRRQQGAGQAAQPREEGRGARVPGGCGGRDGGRGRGGRGAAGG